MFPASSEEPSPPFKESYNPSDTPPCRVKKAWRMPGREARAGASMSIGRVLAEGG
jgi:hypothetical protein